ncbi:hypothetical protein RSOLAG1IB_04058 [Rhizoctonia solani AG-1 IB]|uniref:Uncharacterized protein n=1 Tax=Thanatephorus cucumeris (strain AG1-IB / isolate 7/3/14) TaxID=1108050 RepID=A0A0B7FV96_THACB|nr:hypothetical protein RSOLAG1IB_04058 [Rhizoctonia solani AG-1 IB]
MATEATCRKCGRVEIRESRSPLVGILIGSPKGANLVAELVDKCRKCVVHGKNKDTHQIKLNLPPVLLRTTLGGLMLVPQCRSLYALVWTHLGLRGVPCNLEIDVINPHNLQHLGSSLDALFYYGYMNLLSTN